VNKTTYPVKRNTCKISDLQDEKYLLVTDSEEIAHVIDSIAENQDYVIGCMFVEVLDGEYGEIWASEQFVPYLSATAYQLQ
jgi:hypothetical protein